MRSGYFLLKLIGFTLLSIIISVGIIGVSYAYFTASSRIDFSTSMGDINVIFSNLNIVQSGETNPSCTTEARITDSGKKIEINIANAYPGYETTLCYEVTNNGTVPVKYQLIQPYAGVDNPVQLNVFETSEYIRPNGGKAQGQIIIAVSEDIDDCDSYCLNTELNFQQVVVESR